MTIAERIALQNRAVTITGLVVLALLAWAYLISGAEMPTMPGMVRSPGFPTIAIMWSVMMVAMMVPAASPTILLYARVHRHSKGLDATPPTTAFLAGYLLCWLGFALVAAGLQISLIAPMSFALASDGASGGLLIAAGVYQLSPFKDSCLSRCRSPGVFLSRHFHPGALGALRLGILHGASCVGCCWLLMALLFVSGVMNLIWVAALTILVAAEKLLPAGIWIARMVGIGMVAGGTALILA